MNWFLSTARLTTCDIALLLIGFVGTLAPPPALGQEQKASDQEPSESPDAARKAADQGDAKAQFNLALMYDLGDGVPQDYAEAIRWSRKAADQGDADAQFFLGFSYDEGHRVPRDYAEAALWYRKAADQGDANAQFHLGLMYFRGSGVPQDYAEAAAWYRKAADQGQADALASLRYMPTFGQGVQKDDARGGRSGSGLVAAGTSANRRSQAEAPYTTEQLNSLLSSANLPTGLFLRDTAQTIGSVSNDLNAQNPYLRESNHAGFSLMLYEPKAWLGAKKASAIKQFRSFTAADATEDDRAPVLRVVVFPDSPEYLTALGAAYANDAEHLVLRSIDRKQVAQPVAVQPMSKEFWSGLGARASFTGLVAVFSLADLERIRSISPDREFFVTVIGARKKSNKDFRVKQKHFFRLGD